MKFMLLTYMFYHFFAVPPTVTVVSPATQSTQGLGTLTITGTLFVAGATVTVGGTACGTVVIVSATSITCTAPANAAGALIVEVTNADGGVSIATAIKVLYSGKIFQS